MAWEDLIVINDFVILWRYPPLCDDLIVPLKSMECGIYPFAMGYGRHRAEIISQIAPSPANSANHPSIPIASNIGSVFLVTVESTPFSPKYLTVSRWDGIPVQAV